MQTLIAAFSSIPEFGFMCAVLVFIVMAAWLWHSQRHIKGLSDSVVRLENERTNWMDTAGQHCRNEEYYRSLVQRCGKVFGAAAYQCDDGVSVSQDILCAKVPKLVEQMADQLQGLKDFQERKHKYPNSNRDINHHDQRNP